MYIRDPKPFNSLPRALLIIYFFSTYNCYCAVIFTFLCFLYLTLYSTPHFTAQKVGRTKRGVVETEEVIVVEGPTTRSRASNPRKRARKEGN